MAPLEEQTDDFNDPAWTSESNNWGTSSAAGSSSTGPPGSRYFLFDSFVSLESPPIHWQPSSSERSNFTSSLSEALGKTTKRGRDDEDPQPEWIGPRMRQDQTLPGANSQPTWLDSNYPPPAHSPQSEFHQPQPQYLRCPPLTPYTGGDSIAPSIQSHFPLQPQTYPTTIPSSSALPHAPAPQTQWAEFVHIKIKSKVKRKGKGKARGDNEGEEGGGGFREEDDWEGGGTQEADDPVQARAKALLQKQASMSQKLKDFVSDVFDETKIALYSDLILFHNFLSSFHPSMTNDEVISRINQRMMISIAARPNDCVDLYSYWPYMVPETVLRTIRNHALRERTADYEKMEEIVEQHFELIPRPKVKESLKKVPFADSFANLLSSDVWKAAGLVEFAKLAHLVIGDQVYPFHATWFTRCLNRVLYGRMHLGPDSRAIGVLLRLDPIPLGVLAYVLTQAYLIVCKWRSKADSDSTEDTPRAFEERVAEQAADILCGFQGDARLAELCQKISREALRQFRK